MPLKLHIILLLFTSHVHLTLVKTPPVLACVQIHGGADDLGKGKDEGSKASGNAGARIACCAIVACPEPAGVWFN